MVTINELMIVTGQFLAFAMNAVLDTLIKDPHVWRWMLGIAADPGRRAVRRHVLPARLAALVRGARAGWTTPSGVLNLSRGEAEAAEEYNIIAEHAKRDIAEDKGAALRDLRAFPWMRRILWIGCGLATVQQATGINTVNYYAPTILESTGLGASAALIRPSRSGCVGDHRHDHRDRAAGLLQPAAAAADRVHRGGRRARWCWRCRSCCRSRRSAAI